MNKKMNIILFTASLFVLNISSQKSMALEIPVNVLVNQGKKGNPHETRINTINVYAHQNEDDDGTKVLAFKGGKNTYKNGQAVEIGSTQKIPETAKFLTVSYDLTSSGYNMGGNCVMNSEEKGMIIPLQKGKQTIQKLSFYLNDIEYANDKYQTSCFIKSITWGTVK